MLLRRITKHVKEQNWFAVGLDFFIVVVGILIAFQITNWSEGRQDRVLERDTLIRLYQDISESVEGQQRDIHFLEQQLADQDLILRSLEVCTVAPGDDPAFQRGLATLGWVNPPRLYRRTIDEVIASGRTDIIQSAEISDGLARIVALVEWRGAWFQSTVDTLEHSGRVIERHMRYDLTRTLDNPFVPNHRGGIDYDINALCENVAIGNAISSISYRTSERLEAYRPILEAYSAFLPLVGTELMQRWNFEPQAGAST
ncbi:MAG: hypothetical protein NXH70_08125 [Hyphomonas sp.]|jgi:hypothetical protein|nr:hypothetical protein [Hyphomonas sp.]